MKLPWDKNYLKISFHVIFTIVVIYIISILIKNLYFMKDIILNFISFVTTIFLPLIIALVLSYILNPIVEFFHNKTNKLFKKFNSKNDNIDERFKIRLRGTLITYSIMFIFLGIIVKILVQKIGTADITLFTNMISASLEKFSDLVTFFYVKLEEFGLLQNVDGNFVQEFTTSITNYILNFANSFAAIGSGVLNTFIGFVVSFYFLVEKERILYYCNDIIDVFFKDIRAKSIKSFFTNTNNIFSGYIVGQVTDAMIMATLISISFNIVGINYALVIGIISGFSNLIPFVGAVVAFILSVGVGLLSDDPIKALYAAIIVLVLQQVDSIFIVPKVVGKSVELHPVLVILSLSIFGSLFGIFGMIFAVPITALIKLYITKWYINKKNKKLDNLVN